MRLYTYFRSSAAYRVRIALNLKGIAAESVPVNLRSGEQHADAFQHVNPFALVPALEHDGRLLTQSVAIIEYLEDIQPLPALLPAAAADRAFVRGIALGIACDIHPLNNLRVLEYLSAELKVESAQREQWYAHWIAAGFAPLELLLSRDARVGAFCCGDAPTLADVCLVPQVYNARRMRCDLAPYPTLRRLAAHAEAHPAFAAAHPDRQPDAA